MANAETFVKITNRNIYDAIQAGTKQNAEEHAEIVLHQQRTNGRVKTNRWIATTALTIAFTGIGWALSLV